MSVDSFYHPVHSIGGDFALVNSLDREYLSLLVCDVSGHGIGSALVANRIYSETTAHLRSGMPLVEMFGELNRFLIDEIVHRRTHRSVQPSRSVGSEGVQEIARQTSFLPPDQMKEGILDGVAAWRQGPHTDDVSLVLVHVC